jgi:hypothetical protein
MKIKSIVTAGVIVLSLSLLGLILSPHIPINNALSIPLIVATHNLFTFGTVVAIVFLAVAVYKAWQSKPKTPEKQPVVEDTSTKVLVTDPEATAVLPVVEAASKA